jgi:hypothetical protein
VLILVFWVVIPHELHCFGGTDYLPHQGWRWRQKQNAQSQQWLTPSSSTQEITHMFKSKVKTVEQCQFSFWTSAHKEFVLQGQTMNEHFTEKFCSIWWYVICVSHQNTCQTSECCHHRMLLHSQSPLCVTPIGRWKQITVLELPVCSLDVASSSFFLVSKNWQGKCRELTLHQ